MRSNIAPLCRYVKLETYFPARLELCLLSHNNCHLRSPLPAQRERRKETLTAGQVGPILVRLRQN